MADVWYTAWSNTEDLVWLHFHSPRREYVAKYFWRTSRCLEMWLTSNLVSHSPANATQYVLKFVTIFLVSNITAFVLIAHTDQQSLSRQWQPWTWAWSFRGGNWDPVLGRRPSDFPMPLLACWRWRGRQNSQSFGTWWNHSTTARQ